MSLRFINCTHILFSHLLFSFKLFYKNLFKANRLFQNFLEFRNSHNLERNKMEFPHLGQYCCEKTCNRLGMWMSDYVFRSNFVCKHVFSVEFHVILDFLPMKCDACDQMFCSSHFNYEQHKCTSGLRKDYQVPLCPLCGEPVPTAPGVEPDLTVGQHIDKQCKSDSKKIFTNQCSHKSCKRKELIPVNCSQCKKNFCLRHRHTADHQCQGSAIATTNKQHNEAALKRSMTA